MINRLMRMEERIVLDGAVAAAAVADSSGGDATAPVAPDNPLDNNTDLLDNTPEEAVAAGIDPADSSELNETTAQEVAANMVVAMQEALDTVTDAAPLRALIVNTDIADSADLIAAADDGVIVVTYDGDTEDLQIVIDELYEVSGGSEYESIGLAAHSGAGGEIFLNENEHVTTSSLLNDSEQIAFFSGLGELLTADGRIDLLSCYSGLGEAGNELLTAISGISDAEVAASTDITGNENVNGDWLLENGEIDAAATYFNGTDLLSYSSYLGYEDQSLLGEISVPIDRQLGTAMDYYDGTDDGEDNGILAVMGSDDSADESLVYLYRESDSGYTLETTITLAEASFSKSLALSGNEDGEMLVVNVDNTVYLFEENNDSFHANGWENVVDATDISASSNSFSSGYLSIDILGDTVVVGDEQGASNIGRVYIYEKHLNDIESWDFTDDLSAVLTPTVDSGKNPHFGKQVLLIDANNDGAADQAFITSSSGDNGDDNDDTAGIKDGVYLSKVGEWGLENGSSTQNTTITRNDCIFETTAATAGYTAAIEVLASEDSGNLKEDLFVSFFSCGTYSVAILSGDVHATSFAFSGTGVDLNDIASRAANITMTSQLTDDGAKLLAISTVDAGSGLSGLVEVYRSDGIDSDNDSTTEWERDSGNGIVSGAENGTEDAFGTAMIFTNGNNLLVGAPTYSSVSSAVLPYQGVYTIEYTDGWGTPSGSYNVGQKSLTITTEGYTNQFGTLVAVDDHLAVVASYNVNDGLQVFAYIDKDNTGNYTWEYQSTLKFQDLSPVGTAEFWDLAISGTTVVVSLHGSNGEMVYVFDGVGEDRATPYETDTLTYTGYNDDKDDFGRDIDIEAGAIFISNYDSNYTSENTDDILSIFTYYYSSSDWGNAETEANTQSQQIFLQHAAEETQIHLDADNVDTTSFYNIAVSVMNETDQGRAFVIENVSSYSLGTQKELTFQAMNHGGESSSSGFGSNVAINDDIIVIGMSGYSTTEHYDMGALAVYHAASGSWTGLEDSLTAILTLNTSQTLCNAALGGSALTIGDNGEVFATGGNATIGYKGFGWNITPTTETPSTVETISTPDVYENSVANNLLLAGLAYSRQTKSLFIASPSADKDTVGENNTGVVYTYNVTNYTPDNPIVATPVYVAGSDSGDMGDIVVNFNQPIYLVHIETGFSIVVQNMATSEETLVQITAEEAAAMFNVNNTQLTFDLNGSKFSFIEDGIQYTATIGQNNFTDANGDSNQDPITYTFTIVEGQVIINPDPNVNTNPDDTPNQGSNGDSENDGGNITDGLGTDLGNDFGLDDALAEIAEESGLGEESDGEESDGEEGDGEGNNDEGEGEGTASNEQGQSNNNAANNFGSPSGPAESMIIQNPFAEIITSTEVQIIFDSTLQAFSSLGIDSGTAYGMIQDAMGNTMTTAALVSSCEQTLAAANLLLAEVTDIEGDELSLFGNGMTAEVHSVSTIIENAVADMVQARGNALIASDLLRILTINIKGFDNRLAENSFSAGVKRLASTNEKLAYSYEVLNSILRTVKASKDAGEIISVAELNALLPTITANAHEISLAISEKGDRASKDVLTFLTRRLQSKGIDRENLQAQVSNIFKEWHNNLGLSTAVNVNDTIATDIASSEFLPAGAL